METKKSLLPYTHKNLCVEVPINVRLEVYKKALELIENWRPPMFGLQNSHLCILLPVILWKLPHFELDNEYSEYDWNYEETKYAFPELKDYLPSICSCPIYERDELRIAFLKISIQKLKNEIQ